MLTATRPDELIIVDGDTLVYTEQKHVVGILNGIKRVGFSKNHMPRTIMTDTNVYHIAEGKIRRIGTVKDVADLVGGNKYAAIWINKQGDVVYNGQRLEPEVSALSEYKVAVGVNAPISANSDEFKWMSRPAYSITFASEDRESLITFKVRVGDDKYYGVRELNIPTHRPVSKVFGVKANANSSSPSSKDVAVIVKGEGKHFIYFYATDVDRTPFYIGASLPSDIGEIKEVYQLRAQGLLGFFDGVSPEKGVAGFIRTHDNRWYSFGPWLSMRGISSSLRSRLKDDVRKVATPIVYRKQNKFRQIVMFDSGEAVLLLGEDNKLYGWGKPSALGVDKSYSIESPTVIADLDKLNIGTVEEILSPPTQAEPSRLQRKSLIFRGTKGLAMLEDGEPRLVKDYLQAFMIASVMLPKRKHYVNSTIKLLCM